MVFGLKPLPLPQRQVVRLIESRLPMLAGVDPVQLYSGFVVDVTRGVVSMVQYSEYCTQQKRTRVHDAETIA